VRTFGVEEELLVVNGGTLQPLPRGEQAVNQQRRTTDTGHELTTELQQEQIEVNCPPQTTFLGQLETIRTGRRLADEAAARVGSRAVALPTSPVPVAPHLATEDRARRVRDKFGLTAREQLTCGFHIHVQVDSPDEGVAVLDRTRAWLPVLLALSSNSPYWDGQDTGFASYRYQAWSRWPTAGPPEHFGSAAAYTDHRRALLDSGVPLDPGMLYFDARLSEHQPTVEFRVADVCLDPAHAAVIATLVRAMVETAARSWRSGGQARPVRASVLRTWSWQASRMGVEGRLVDPATGALAPAGDVVTELLGILRPVLVEQGEDELVDAVVADILAHGSGARRQRAAHDEHGGMEDVVRMAIEATHGRRASEGAGVLQ
jgi:glutamate---cysteine ligase / carboxylate-amine ligase